MPGSYDFSTLAPDDFERLVGDLIGAMLSVKLQEFTAGRDRGIDLRYATPDDPQSLVVQCKLYSATGYARLLRAIEREEVPKIRRLNPARYVLATSVPLTPAQKDELTASLRPWCLSSNDVLGRDDLNALLRRFPDIERQHFKLWLTSTAVLENVLNAGMWNLTASTIDEVRREICRFVEHPGVHAADLLLTQYHHCLIVGVPGIGKTTLAHLLMYRYVSEGYTPVVVSADIAEALSVVRGNEERGIRTIILYDDFLGQVSFETTKLEKNEDRRLMALIDHVERSSHVKLLLTTREYILADAMKHYATLERSADKIRRFVLQLGHYDEPARARILFNHLYFSDLPSGRLNSIVASGVYWKIIRHNNYNPRIIRSIAEHRNFSSLSDAEYTGAILGLLNDPAEVWGHAFDYQISPDSRRFLLALWAMGSSSPLSALRTQLAAAFKASDNLGLESRIRDCLRELDGNFVNTVRCQIGYRPTGVWDVVVSFHNPSIRDFMSRRVRAQPALLEDVAQTIATFDQAVRLLTAFPVHVQGTKLGGKREAVFDTALALLDEPTLALTSFNGIQYLREQRPDPFSRLSSLISLCANVREVELLRRLVRTWFLTEDSIEDAITQSSLESVTSLFSHCTREIERLPDASSLLSSEEISHARKMLIGVGSELASSASTLEEVREILDAFDLPGLYRATSEIVRDWQIELLVQRLLIQARDGELSESRLRDEIDNLRRCSDHLGVSVDWWVEDLQRLLPGSETAPEQPREQRTSRKYDLESDIEDLFHSLCELRDASEN